jgi:hypothetical protein
MRLYTCHIVKGIVFKFDVDDHVPILLVNHVSILLMTSGSGVVEVKFHYELASRKPCSKS